MNNKRKILVYLMITACLLFGFVSSRYLQYQIEQLQKIRTELIGDNLDSYMVIINYQSELAHKVEQIVERENAQKEYESKIETINSFLSGVLKNKASVFVNAAFEYELDPYLLIAISLHETGYGKSNIAVNKNNVCGCMASSGAMSFKSVEESIYYMASNLRKNYINQGLSTIEQIQQKYAPKGAENDAQGLNHYWSYNVSSIYNNLVDG